MTTSGPRHDRAAAALSRPLPMTALVVGVGLVVALATRGLHVLLPALELEPGPRLAIRAAGALAAAAGFMALLRQRRLLLAAVGRNPDPTVVGLRTAATLMIVVAVLGVFGPPRHVSPKAGGGAFGFLPLDIPAWGLGATGRGEPPPQVRGGDSPVRSSPRDVAFNPLDDAGPADHEDLARIRRWFRILPALLLLLALIMLSRRRRRPRTLEVPEPDGPLKPAQAEAVLEASLEEVTGDEADPRWQITKAYRRLLSALEAAEAGREPHEAPYEHLHRVLGPLGVRPEHLHHLAELYVQAQFSERAMGDEHRAEASRNLEASLADLRAATPPPRVRFRRRPQEVVS